MLENGSGIGSLNTTNAEKQNFAKKSIAYNDKNPDFVALFKDDLKKMGLTSGKVEAPKKGAKV